MTAIQYRRIGAEPELIEIPTPEPGPGEVLLETTAAGVCHWHSVTRALDASLPSAPVWKDWKSAQMCSSTGRGDADAPRAWRTTARGPRAAGRNILPRARRARGDRRIHGGRFAPPRRADRRPRPGGDRGGVGSDVAIVGLGDGQAAAQIGFFRGAYEVNVAVPCLGARNELIELVDMAHQGVFDIAENASRSRTVSRRIGGWPRERCVAAPSSRLRLHREIKTRDALIRRRIGAAADAELPRHREGLLPRHRWSASER